MRNNPNKFLKNKQKMQKPVRKSPKTAISEPRAQYVYRKDAFKKVKIT
jgi:hypothetical protein